MVLNKKQIIFFGGLGLIIVIILSFFVFARTAKTNFEPIKKTVGINNQVINVEIASSPEQQYIGLSNRDSICADCGMLFVFRDLDEREFVMRDMKFPLDIIFIAKGKIINIAEKLAPEGHETIYIYKSLAPADMVLEVNSGYTEKYGIKPGDNIKISN